MILDGHRGVVGRDHLRGENPPEHRLRDRLQESGAGGHPVTQRRAGEFDAVSLEDPFLAVERQVVGELAGDDVGQEPRPRQPLLNRLGEPRCDHDVRGAAGAGIFRSDVRQHDQARGDVFELLADLLAEEPALAAAFGTGAVFGSDVMDDPLAGQARRQRLATVATRLGLRLSRCPWWKRGRHRLGLGPGQDVARKKQELIGIDRLAFLAVSLPQELFDLMLKLGDEVALLPQGLRLLADLAVGGVEVVGECGVAGRHTLITVTRESVLAKSVEIFRRRPGRIAAVSAWPSGRCRRAPRPARRRSTRRDRKPARASGTSLFPASSSRSHSRRDPSTGS